MSDQLAVVEKSNGNGEAAPAVAPAPVAAAVSPAQAAAPTHGWNSTDTLAIASVPAAGYLFAYTYERAYCSGFGIPIQFISLSLESIFGVVTVLSLVAYIYLGMAFYFIKYRPGTPLGAMIHRLMEWAVFLLMICISTSASTSFVFFYIVLWAVMASILLGKPALAARRERATYLEVLKRFDIGDEMHSTHPWNQVAALVGKYWTKALFILACICTLTWIAGRDAARGQQDFPVIVGAGAAADLVVLRVYAGNAICAKLDRSAHAISREFSLIKLGADPHVFMKVEAVGPLVVK